MNWLKLICKSLFQEIMFKHISFYCNFFHKINY